MSAVGWVALAGRALSDTLGRLGEAYGGCLVCVQIPGTVVSGLPASVGEREATFWAPWLSFSSFWESMSISTTMQKAFPDLLFFPVT